MIVLGVKNLRKVGYVPVAIMTDQRTGDGNHYLDYENYGLSAPDGPWYIIKEMELMEPVNLQGQWGPDMKVEAKELDGLRKELGVSIASLFS